MEILAVKLQQIDHPFASGKVWQMTVQTNYEPAEIIVIRPDGTSESTDPEALKLRENAAYLNAISARLNGRAEIESEVSRLTAERDQALKNCQKLAKKAFGIEGHEKEIERLESELKEKNAYLERIRIASAIPGREPYDHAPLNCVTLLAGHANNLQSELKAANDELRSHTDVRGLLLANNRLEAERDQLKRQLENVTNETIKRQAERIAHLIALVEKHGNKGGTIRPDDVVTFRADWNIPEHNGKPFATMVENGELVKILRADRDKIAGRLSKCREEKRELKERLQGEVLRLETLRDVRQALGCTFGDVVAAARGMVQHDTKMCQIICRISDKIGCRSGDVETGVANLFDGYNTQHAELSQAKAELQESKAKLDAVTRALSG